MAILYEMFFLSDLLKKSRKNFHPDYLATLNYIQQRLDNIESANSEFNNQIKWIKKILPKSLIIKILYRLRYDALIGFYTEDGQPKQIYGMLTFQKHPQRVMIGMFDVYVSPERRNKDLSNHFQTIAKLVYELTQQFRHSGYRYIQCGKNQTTKRLLSLYEKICRRNQWGCHVDITESRIYL